MSATLLKGGQIVSMDETVGELVGDVLIEDGRIAAVGPALDVPAGAETVDVSGSIVLPGLIDAHIHLWQAAVRGLAAGCWGREYFALVHPLSARLSADGIRTSTYGGALELLRHGVTTMLDFCHSTNSPEHADAAFEALDDAGVRAFFGFSFRDRPELDVRGFGSLADRIRVLGQLVAARGGHDRVTVAAALNNIDHVSAEDHAREVGAARELGLLSTVHSNLQGQVAQAHAQGLLGDDVMWVHCGPITDHELRLLAEQGAPLISTPEVESTQVAITPLIGRALRHEVRVALGSDVPSALNGDPFTLMRLAHALDRHADSLADRLQGREPSRPLSPPTVDARTLLRLVTIDAARALKIEDRVGGLAPGKLADVTVLSTEPFGIGASDPVSHVVFQAGSRDVRLVLVGGERRVVDGELVGVDTAKLRRELDDVRDGVLADGGVDPALRALYEAGQGDPRAAARG
jgi:5-methylthioadenosine/S-adenosylhomocysteine deaminase